MRAVGGSDFDERRAGAGHDVRHAESAADLDQLAPRDDGFASARKGVEREKNGGCIVVDDGCIFGAGQRAEKLSHVIIAFAALARRQVEFQSDRFSHRFDRGLDRGFGKHRAAEVRMEHGAREIEERAQTGAILVRETHQREGCHLFDRRDG